MHAAAISHVRRSDKAAELRNFGPDAYHEEGGAKVQELTNASPSPEEPRTRVRRKKRKIKEEDATARPLLADYHHASSPYNKVDPDHPIPWAHTWPDLLEYHRRHMPDFSGMKLYMPDEQFPLVYRAASMRNPANFTLQVLHSETAKLHGCTPPKTLVALKGQAIAMINRIIGDPTGILSVDAALAIAAIALYGMVFENNIETAAAHLSGLRIFLSMRGGIETLNDEPLAKNLVHAADGMYTHLTQRPRFFPRPDKEAERLVAIGHPLRLAIQPTRSGLSPATLRNHLLVSIGAPIQGILGQMLHVKKLARAAMHMPYKIAALAAQSDAVEMIMALQRLGTIHRQFGLSSDVFSEQDRAFHFAAVECARCVTQVLLARLIQILCPTTVSASRLDHSVQVLHKANMDSDVLGDSEIFFWSLFVAASFTPAGVLREQFVARLGRLCFYQLGFRSWDALLACLDRYYWVAEIQEAETRKVWKELERWRRQDMHEIP